MTASTSDLFTRIEVGALVLRRPRTDDAVAFHVVESDPRLWELYPEKCLSTRDETNEKLAWMIEHWDTHGFGIWLAELDGVVVGSGGMRFHEMDDGERVLNIYYRISPEAQGNGIASRIVAMVLEHAPHVAPGLAIVIRTDERNAAARRVGEKHGFEYQGVENWGFATGVILRHEPPSA